MEISLIALLAISVKIDLLQEIHTVESEPYGGLTRHQF
jgi:hypothetical protein